MFSFVLHQVYIYRWFFFPDCGVEWVVSFLSFFPMELSHLQLLKICCFLHWVKTNCLYKYGSLLDYPVPLSCLPVFISVLLYNTAWI